MSRTVRVGNAHGFWGDRFEAAAQTLALEPDLDFLTFDFLAEVSMSILARQQQRRPDAGFAADFVEIVSTLASYWKSGGACRVISNAGGLNPLACAEACRLALEQAGCTDRSIAVVTGDSVLEMLRADARSGRDSQLWRHLDSGAPITSVLDRLATANAYLGARPIAEALDRGADLVITGRVADPSLTVAACAHHFGWAWDDWDRLAGATIAGHLIECGTQVTGGISTDWLEVPEVAQIGFPIVEVDADGACVVTKPRDSGGAVTPAIVKEQLLYEIGDPDNYLSPDVTVSFLTLELDWQGPDRVHLRGARGRPAPDTYKVSATWQNGFRASGQLTIFGEHAARKAHRAGDTVLAQLRNAGIELQHTRVDTIGAGACALTPTSFESHAQIEVVLRIAAWDESREPVEQFTRAMTPLITAGPPGTTGYADGRPRVHPQFSFWPCLVQRDRVQAVVQHLPGSPLDPAKSRCARPTQSGSDSATKSMAIQAAMEAAVTVGSSVLSDIATARSGDKGQHANIGVIARQSENYPQLLTEVTTSRVADFLRISDERNVIRYELPNLHAVNIILRDVLCDPIRLDAQGKTFAQALLRMPLISLPNVL